MENLFEELTSNNDAISLAKKLAENVQETYFDLGCLLYHIKEDDIYKTYNNNKYYADNHAKWKLFCEENLSVSYRTAQYWLNLYRYFTDMGISKEKVVNIGWSKAKELIDFTDDINKLERALKVAEEGTLEDLKHHIDTVKSIEEKVGEDNREVLKSKIFNFKLYEAAAETVDEILEKVCLQEKCSKSEALFKIFIEWHQINTYVEAKEEDLITIEDEPSDEEELVQLVEI